MATSPRVRPYKDYLTPALHRRFAMATATLFGLCYVESVLIAEWNSLFWSWFPFGRAGIRTGLLFIPAFMIFILRVAQLHVGLRTSFSAWETFRSFARRFDIIQTLGWYFLSAYLFSEIYVWSASKDADLNRIKLQHRTDRPIINEKPIYLTSFLYFLAAIQSGVHLFYDYDRIDMPVTKTKPIGSPEQLSHLIVPPATQLKSKIPSILISCLTRTLVIMPFFPFLYNYTVRKFAYTFTRSWAKIFWNLPKSSALPTTGPWHWTVMLRTFTSGFLLLMLWEVGNAAFSAYVAQEPLKNDRPITYESRDPNGSLLTGLKGVKLQTRAFAFWELVYIAQRFEGRRKNIYEDIDRTGGSTWSQILSACLDVIKGMDSRIAEYQSPTASASDKNLGFKDSATSTESEPLPRMVAPLQDGLRQAGDIFSQSPPPRKESQRSVEALGRFAKRHGQSPNEGLSLKSKALLSKAESSVLSERQKQALSAQGLAGLFKEQITWILQSRLGWPFRQEYRRRIAAVVLGNPYGDVGIIVDAVDALSRFAVCSLTEDKIGHVQKDLRTIILTFTNAIEGLEAFQRSVGLHWTDVEGKQESPEVDTILAALRGGLGALIATFGDYADGLKLGLSDMRRVREAAGVPAKISRKI
ncbi:hypothetical protein HYALB_00005705 [Hymenoscyphus albidus]|uniref:Nuclear envelope protein n=1 Tax=Hymenoscyphus albidus TaxID=595503 RepID=A0A9N9LPZ7_9HELO|nr:hypothetical protein HYALB_00005705 [Hymenoscyphus albidus]